jgi:hypothetical protein
MKKYIFFVVILSCLLLLSVPLAAGNREMIENRIDQLDKLNKDAVERIAGHPESGIVNIKVRAIPGKDGYRFEPVEKEKASSATNTVLPRESEGGYFTFREGISRIAKNKPAITPYRLSSDDGEYVLFKNAIIRLVRREK